MNVNHIANIDQLFSELVRLDNGSFLAGGIVYDESPFDQEVNGDYNWDVVVSSFDPFGNEEWSRLFHYVSSHEDEHLIMELINTSDGGILFCGRASDLTITSPDGAHAHQGWLVKTDEYGCLVPGCHVSIDEFEEKNGLLKINPNPAEDFINVFIGQTEVSGTLEVVDGLGRVIDQTSVSHGNTTFLFDCTQYQSGQYMVRFVSQDRGILEVEKVLVR